MTQPSESLLLLNSLKAELSRFDYVKGGYREIISGTILEIDTFEFKDYKTDTDFGEYALWCPPHAT
jgi:hypothetical protein